MRIAVLSAQRGVVGGVETYLRWLLPELSTRGHRLAQGYRYEAADPALTIDRGVALDSGFVATESGIGALERSADPRARSALIELGADPDLTKEIQVILRRLNRRGR